MSAAVALLAETEACGARLRVTGNGNVKAAGVPLPLLARLREHKAKLLELLAGKVCRHCGKLIEDLQLGWVPFLDGTAAHVPCYERAEVERIRRRAANAATPEALADEAEISACREGFLR